MAIDAEASGSSSMSQLDDQRPVPPTMRRAMIYLAICAAFAAGLVASMLLGKAAPAAVPPCTAGTSIGQVAVTVDTAGLPHIFATVRPVSVPNAALGSEPGCQALYRSDDNGITWTVVFSATAEAPLSIAATGPSQVYLLTQRLQFPLYLAGNLYRSDRLGDPWTWSRISPQGRRDIPDVSITDALIGADSLVLRVGNGDGGALLRSIDGGASWQSLVIPNLVSTSSVAMLGHLIAVTPAHYAPGASPGLKSVDGGVRWLPLGRLPHPPTRSDMRPILNADPVTHSLILSLLPGAAAVFDHPIVRYVSLDDGNTWMRVRCGTLPAPGCAPPARWAQAGATRYVLYHRHIFRATAGTAWQMLPTSLPVPSGSVLQMLAASAPGGDAIYIATADAIWRLEGQRWRRASTGLALSNPITPTPAGTPVQG